MTKKILSICFALLTLGTFAQEEEYDLQMNVQQALRHLQEREFPAKSDRGNGSLSLPFFDDFSTYSLPTNDPEIPMELQRWSDSSAYVNCHFPILPPTIGVATLDGLNGLGYPYDFIADSYGPADTLTSLPIDLSGLTADDNVYLTFFYQGGGRGNAPNPQDSLLVEFFAPIGGENPWFHVWSIPGIETDGFEQVFIPISEDFFLEDGFRFRIRNYATLSGNLDHWHIDYVFVNDNIDPENFDFFEVAFAECPNTLLQDLTSMPWTHFKTNPSQFMRQTISTTQRNLSNSQADNVTSGFKVQYEEQEWDYQNDFSIVVVGPGEVFETDYAINSTPNDFVYNDAVSDTTATFNVSFYEDVIGILAAEKIGVPNNDSLVFEQRFQNYYAYDDGSAERAYSLNVSGGKMAVKYNVVTPDTLLGLFIHFTPFQDNNDNESFILRVWDDNGGVPGDEITDNFQFQTPSYFEDGYNVFAYYPFDMPVEVEGTIYVGLVQNTAQQLNVGLDKNTNANPTRLFFQLGLGADWQQSEIQGSVMIRPVFKAGMTNIWNGVDESYELNDLNVYPIPFNESLQLSTPAEILLKGVMYDLQGRLAAEISPFYGSTRIDAAELPKGIYLLHLFDVKGNQVAVRRLVKQ